MTNTNRFRDVISKGRPTDWFEPLYADSNVRGDGVPWAHMSTHPMLSAWLGDHPLDGTGKSALVIGCGMGDDAIQLESLGFAVTAFDVSASAIAYCNERFPTSTVQFVRADLFDPQPAWQRAFDVVLEIYTIQALPPQHETTVINAITDYVADNGQLLVITKVGAHKRDLAHGPPWS